MGRICNFLKRWVEQHYDDFETDGELMDAYSKFIANIGIEISMKFPFLSPIQKPQDTMKPLLEFWSVLLKKEYVNVTFFFIHWEIKTQSNFS